MLCYLILLDHDRDKEAFAQVYHTRRSLLLRVAYTFFPDHQALAEDAVHNAFLSLAYNFKKYSSLSCHEQTPYLVTIVKNACRDLLRKNKKYVGWDEFSDADRIAPPYTGELDEMYQRTVALIWAMPEKYREILELRLLEGLSNAQAAKRLGILENTAAQRYNRARKMVAEQLTKEGLGLD